MKALLTTLFFSSVFNFCFSQNGHLVDSLKHQLTITKQDTSQVQLLIKLCWNSTLDSAYMYGEQAANVSQRINFPQGKIDALSALGRKLTDAGNLPKALKLLFNALQIVEENQLALSSPETFYNIGRIYRILADFPKTLRFFQRAKQIYEHNHNRRLAANVKLNIGNIYENMNQLDSASMYLQQGYDEMILTKGSVDPIYFIGVANIQKKTGNIRKALAYSKKGYQLALKVDHPLDASLACVQIATLYRKQNQPDSGIYFARLGLTIAQRQAFKRGILSTSTLLSELYEPTDVKEALRYAKLAAATKDSLFSAGNMQMIAQEQDQQREIELAKEAYQNQLRQYALLTGLAMFLLISFILYRTNRQKQKANAVLEQALSQLKATQTQLIQREKMASLGELTAGIAHEIQNPLNFVNNFAELSVELVDEQKEALTKGDSEEAQLIADELVNNLQKVTRHGQRASSIVKGMLEHSRTSSGQKEPTDLNALADEYLRLAYQGLRAKDITFSCELMTDFAPDLPLANVVPQEIGRVLLNLYNNAFYTVAERQKTASSAYQPTIWVRTAQVDGRVQIGVKDNGTGIPESVKAKIFQPFFTTKPTGEGTGLGLSLSYDIVIKGHGGTLDVQSEAGEFTEFSILLPIA
jgi:two-component system NtrC family sensor kinase